MPTHALSHPRTDLPVGARDDHRPGPTRGPARHPGRLPAVASPGRVLTAALVAGAVRVAGAARVLAGAVRVVAVAVALGAALGLVGGAAPAAAHSALISSDPADASTVAVAPAQLILTFNEPAIALGTVVEVRGPDDRTVSAGDAVLDGATVTQALTGDLPAGEYTAVWRVTSADGHPIDGELRFTAAGPTTVGAPGAAPTTMPGSPATEEPAASPTTEATPAGTPTPGATTDDHAGHGDDADGASTAPLLAGGVAAVAALGVAVTVLLRRRRAGTPGAPEGSDGADGTRPAGGADGTGSTPGV